MTIDKQEIKALALACDPAKCADEAEEDRRLAEFHSELTPEAVLALLAEIERLEADGRDAKDAKVGLGWAVNELRSSFKNFHRSLCARFGYTHDEKDWFRDQVSLEEHVAGQIDQLKTESEVLRKDAERYRWLREKDWIQVEVDVRCGESETLPEMDAVIDAAMAREASHD